MFQDRMETGSGGASSAPHNGMVEREAQWEDRRQTLTCPDETIEGHKKAHGVWSLHGIKVVPESFGYWCIWVSDFWGPEVYNKGVCGAILILPPPTSAMEKDLLTPNHLVSAGIP